MLTKVYNLYTVENTMSTPKKPRVKKPANSVIPIRMPGDMETKIKHLSQKSRLSDQDIMRMALDRGLTALEKMFEQPPAAAA
jgi:hypothetical protein